MEDAIVPIIALLIPIIICLSAFLFAFGMYYLKRRERMALIERGMDPNANQPKEKGRTFSNLSTSLLAIGVGIGLLLAYLFTTYYKPSGQAEGNTAIYFSLIFIFGGIGMLVAYLTERKYWQKEK